MSRNWARVDQCRWRDRVFKRDYRLSLRLRICTFARDGKISLDAWETLCVHRQSGKQTSSWQLTGEVEKQTSIDGNK